MRSHRVVLLAQVAKRPPREGRVHRQLHHGHRVLVSASSLLLLLLLLLLPRCWQGGQIPSQLHAGRLCSGQRHPWCCWWPQLLSLLLRMLAAAATAR